MSDSTFEYVCQTLFIHLDDKNEDVQTAVFKTLEFAGAIRPKIVYQEVQFAHTGLQEQAEAEVPATLRKADRAAAGRSVDSERGHVYFLINNFCCIKCHPKTQTQKPSPRKTTPRLPPTRVAPADAEPEEKEELAPKSVIRTGYGRRR